MTAGSQIRVAAGTSQQLLNQVLGVRQSQTPTTKLQVVHAPSPSQQQQTPSTQQQSQTTTNQQNQQNDQQQKNG